MTLPCSSFNMPKRMYLRAASQAWPELIKNMFSENATEFPPLSIIKRPLKPKSWPMTSGAPKVWIIGEIVSLKHSMEAKDTRLASGLMCVAGKTLSFLGTTSLLSLQCDTTLFAMVMHADNVFARKSIVKTMDARSPARVNSENSWPVVFLKFSPACVYLSAMRAPNKQVVAKNAFWPAMHLPLCDVVVPMEAHTFARWCAISLTVVRCT
mmetsp:Transcript_12251/g.31656  ORF Transcript_12251/g.31656 Transcript_12251/m.31656 type:complete len:210 (-) Transcript_12251:512-1141(-)